MLELLLWLLLIELLGLLSFPLAFRVFPGLPDRGWTFTKPLGLLFLSYGAWLAGLSHTIPNSRWSVLLAMAVLLVLVWFVGRKHWAGMVAFLRKEAPVLVYGELLFAVVFLAFVVLRGYVPEISHTEQPMDFMFLNSVVTSPHYPPNDPWLAGQPVSYYYFGYLMMGSLSLLSGVTTSIAYNLALATIAAMAALAVFGIVSNLVRLSRGSPMGASLAGLGAAFLLIGASSLAGGLFFLQALGLGGDGFWDWAGIEGLSAPLRPSWSWIPAGGGWWWWPASRVLPGAITEFPQFSFLLGDLHPHVMSIPFVLLVVVLGVQLYLSPSLLSLGGLRRQWPLLLAASLAIGALAAINIWDLPLALAVLGGATFLHAVRHRPMAERPLPGRLVWLPWLPLILAGLLVPVFWNLREVGFSVRTFLLVEGALLASACLLAWGSHALKAALVAFGLAMAALALFVPFYLTFESSAAGILPLQGLQTRPVHLLLVWGVQGLLALALLGAVGRHVLRRQREWGDRLLLSAAVGIAPVVLWLQPVWGLLAYAGFIMVFVMLRLLRRHFSASARRFADAQRVLLAAIGVVAGLLLYDALVGAGPEPGGAGQAFSRLLVVVPLALVVTFSLYGAWRLAWRPGGNAREVDAGSDVPPEPVNVSAVVLGLLALAGALVMGVELFHVADVFGGFLRRMNTVFKLYYQAWLLLAIVGGYALHYVTVRWDLRRNVGKLGLGIWATVITLLFAVVFYYPLASTNSRISDSGGPFTLDGQAYVAAWQPEEHQAIQWIRDNLPRDAVVLEAAVIPCFDNPQGCGDWTPAGRIAGSTGRPTVLAWDQHELQWRDSPAVLHGRLDDVREIYETTGLQRAKDLLSKYEVRYVVTSSRERSAYGLEGMGKFAALGEVVYAGGDPGGSGVIIYQVAP